MTLEDLMSIDKNSLENAAKSISSHDLPQLVDLLSEKNDKIRYQAFLLLQYRSQYKNDLYPYWDIFRLKLKSDNSYQRSIGLMLIAENTKWDTENRLDESIDEYLAILHDEKPITIRQCIQSLIKIIPYKPNLNDKIADKLISMHFEDIKETMRKSILLDILKILIVIRKGNKTDKIENFILNALSGEILDKKSKKEIENLLLFS